MFWTYVVVLATVLSAPSAIAQDRTGYLQGPDQGLEMMVNILGQVKSPGEYRVPDQTDLINLLSRAGGPTEFSRLSAVTVRRSIWERPSPGMSGPPPRIEIFQVDIERALRDQNAAPPPILKPGDVVIVPQNSWHRWKNLAAVVRDLSVVASAYFLYLRATKD